MIYLGGCYFETTAKEIDDYEWHHDVPFSPSTKESKKFP